MSGRQALTERGEITGGKAHKAATPVGTDGKANARAGTARAPPAGMTPGGKPHDVQTRHSRHHRPPAAPSCATWRR